MKRPVSVLWILALTLAIGSVGCKKSPKGPTPIPGARTPVQSSEGGFPGIPRGPALTDDNAGRATRLNNPDGSISAADLKEFEGMLMDAEVFKANTVYFDFDRANVKPSERPKMDAVASFLKENAAHKLLIEGHCDERGTEEYNRALGERRAQALREHLSNLGVAPERVRTISYGEDRPAIDGHNEEAWSKNRRGDFILLKPKQ